MVVENPRTVQSMARQYVAVHGKDGRLISTAAGARALRAAMSRSSYSDRELADFIAEAAVTSGCNIQFDGIDRSGDKIPSRQE